MAFRISFRFLPHFEAFKLFTVLKFMTLLFLMWIDNEAVIVNAMPCPCPEPQMLCSEVNQSCVCNTGHYISQPGDTCYAAYDSSCRFTSECDSRNLDYAVCTQGRCLCDLGFFYPGGTHRTNCFEAFRSTCARDEECGMLMLNAACRGGQCECRDGYYYMNTTLGCVPVLHSPCAGDVDCSRRGGDNFKCTGSGICSCGDDYFVLDNRCHPVTGSGCTSNDECLSRGRGDHVCEMERAGACVAACDGVECGNGGLCSVDVEESFRGFVCRCTHPYAGVTCAHTEQSVVVTRLSVPAAVQTASKAFFNSTASGLLRSLVFGHCRRNVTCSGLMRGQLQIEMISAVRLRGSLGVDLTYIVLNVNSRLVSLVSSADVVKILSRLSPAEMGRRIGYTVAMPARGIVEVEPPDYCKIRWGFEISSRISKPLQSLKQKLSSLAYRALSRGSDVTDTLHVDRLATKILNASVASGVLEIVFTVNKEYACLPALSFTRLIKQNFTKAELIPVLGLVPISYPTVAMFSIESRTYYQNAFVIKTLMDLSKDEAYFALSWSRFESGLTRIVFNGLERYLGRFELTESSVRNGRAIETDGLQIMSRLLDVRRVGSTDVVELIAYTELWGHVQLIEHVLHYLNDTSPEDVAIQLQEAVVAEDFARAYDLDFTPLGNLTSGRSTPCIRNGDDVKTMRYWTRTVLIIHAKYDVETTLFREMKRISLTRLFLDGITLSQEEKLSPFTERKIPSICLEMVNVRRLSYDSGHTELVYYVTLDNTPVLPSTLVRLSSHLPLQRVALTLGEVVDETRIVEPYSRSLRPVTASPTSDKVFIVAFMESYVEADWPVFENYSLRLYFTTCSRSPARVTVRSPKATPIYKVNLRIYPKRENFLVIPHKFMLRGTAIQPHALLITSDQPINVVAVNRDYLTHDATLVLPVNRLGRDYYAVSIWPDGTQSQLAVAAYTDSVVTVSLPRKESGHHYEVMIGGVRYTGTLTVTIRAMEVLQIQVAGDLTGARITSDSPVAVFSGNVAAGISGLSRDHLYEQIMPSSRAGTSFIITTPVVEESRHPDLVKVIATESDTLLSIPIRNRTISIVDPGDAVNLELNERDYSVYIYTNKPIKVFQFSKSARNTFSDPSLVELSPHRVQANYHVFIAPSAGYRNFLHYLVLHIESEYISGLRLNNEALQTSVYDWHTVAHTYPEISMSSLQLVSGTYRIWHTDRLVTFTAYVYGMSSKESYSLRAGSCSTDDVSDFLPTTISRTSSITSTRRKVFTDSNTDRFTTEGLPWPVNTEKPTTRSRTSTVPVSWVTRLPQATPTQPSFPIIINRTVSVLTTSRPITTRTEASTSTTSATTHTFSTMTSTSELPTAPLVDAQYWLWFAVEDTEFSLSELQKSRMERLLLEAYVNQSTASSHVQKRALQTTDDIPRAALIKIFRLEPYFNGTAVLFYVLENGSPVNASLVQETMAELTTSNLTHLLGIRVIEPVTEYIRGADMTTVFEEAGDSAEDDEGTPIWAIVLMILFSLGGVALLVFAVVQYQKDELPAPIRRLTNRRKESKRRLSSKHKLQTNTTNRESGGGDSNQRDLRKKGSSRLKTPAPLDKQIKRLSSAKQDESSDSDNPGSTDPMKTEIPGGKTSPSVGDLENGTMADGGGPGENASDKQSSRDAEGGVSDGRLPSKHKSLSPEYPMMLSTEKIDNIFAPYLINHSAQNEICKNKKLLRRNLRNGKVPLKQRRFSHQREVTECWSTSLCSKEQTQSSSRTTTLRRKSGSIHRTNKRITDQLDCSKHCTTVRDPLCDAMDARFPPAVGQLEDLNNGDYVRETVLNNKIKKYKKRSHLGKQQPCLTRSQALDYRWKCKSRARCLADALLTDDDLSFNTNSLPGSVSEDVIVRHQSCKQNSKSLTRSTTERISTQRIMPEKSMQSESRDLDATGCNIASIGRGTPPAVPEIKCGTKASTQPQLFLSKEDFISKTQHH